MIQSISPIDGRLVAERPAATEEDIDRTLGRARRAHASWRATPLEERQRICSAFVDVMEARAEELAREITLQIGRPIRQTPGEIRGLAERARHMIAIAPESLADVPTPQKDGFLRFVRRDPLGLVFVVSAWNYPYLITVNSVIPALLAGNVVVLKHSSQTPLCAERFAEGLRDAGLPDDVFGVLHMGHDATSRVAGDPRVDFVVFTGSVGGGRAMCRAMGERFIHAGLELGGKDPAYVRADAHLESAAVNVADGAFFNAGQSCCGIERVYVHRSIYEPFVEAMVAEARALVLGDPLDPATSLGPVVRTRAADAIRAQVDAALGDGAVELVGVERFGAARPGTPYVAPQILVDVDHSMDVMREETFGPIVGVMPVDSDEEAIALMNDSELGLTASVWTEDTDAALRIGAEVASGTFFMNRCDYVDPALAWTGVKDSGVGYALSPLGFGQLTRPHSFHLRRSLRG